MTILLGSFVNLFAGFTSPLTPSLTPPASPQAFRQEVIINKRLLKKGEQTCVRFVLYWPWCFDYYLYRNCLLDFHW